MSVYQHIPDAGRRRSPFGPKPDSVLDGAEGRQMTQLGQRTSPEINVGETFNRHQVWYTLKSIGSPPIRKDPSFFARIMRSRRSSADGSSIWPACSVTPTVDSSANRSTPIEADNAFAEWVIQTDASLDWIFFERGLPFMSNARYLGRVEMVESGGLDSMFSSVAPALKRGRSKAP